MAEHGTRARYRAGCRCGACTTAAREYAQRWRAANPDRVVEYSSEWYRANREMKTAYDREWYAANRERKSEYNRRRRPTYKPPPEKVRARSQTRRAREMNAFVEHVDSATVYERDDWICHICNEQIDRQRKHPDPLSVSLDHVIPLVAGTEAGGVHSYANCAASHLRCNLIKGRRIMTG